MIDNLQVTSRQGSAFRPAETNGKGDPMPLPSISNGILGEAAVMRQVQLQLQHLSATATNVLIYGEPGTGKRLVARAIHGLAGDADAAVSVISCSEGLPAIQQVLEKLAVPGTVHGPATLILEGIGDLSPTAQAELVQSLDGPAADDHSDDPSHESGNGHDNGHTKPRVVAIFAGDAPRAFAEGWLNRDAIQRLAPFHIGVPALHEREDDAVLLAHYFLALLNSEEGTSKTLSGDSLLFLRRYRWPGNVRELRSAVQRAFVLADRELQLAAATKKETAPIAGEAPSLRIVVGTSLADAEKRMIVATLKKCGGNKTRAAALLGVSLKTLYNRLNGYRAQGLELSQVDPEYNEVAV